MKMNRLRILQIFARYLQYGGEEGSVSRIASVLRTAHEVDYFTASTQDLLEGGPLARFLLPLSVIYNRSIARELRLLQETERYDCWQIHNVFPAISPSAYSTAFRMGIPVIHYLHNYKFGCANGFLFHDGKENRDCLDGNFWPAARDATWRGSHAQSAVMAAILYYTRTHLNVFEKITRWIAISHAQKDIHVQMGIPEDRIDVVPHFLHAPPLSTIPPFPTDGHGLFVGRLSPEKGVDRLLRAWALLSPGRRLVIMGDGPSLEPLIRLTRELGIESWVTFTGFVEKGQQQQFWEGAAFSIVPSIWQEPFGMVVLEAWAQGRPVVAHSIGALSEIIRDGVDGFLADPGSIGSLSTKLEQAFSTTTDLQVMGMNGYLRLGESYNKEVWLQRMETVYSKAGILRTTTIPR